MKIAISVGKVPMLARVSSTCKLFERRFFSVEIVDRSVYLPYVLKYKRWTSPDSAILRFGLPKDVALGASLPQCLKVQQQIGDHLLSKSYSPISRPGQKGHFDLVVKSYPPREADHPGTHGLAGGLGKHLCDLQVGETAQVSSYDARTL